MKPHSRRQPRASRHRRGVLAPILAVALLVVLAALALVLDRLWLDMAQTELSGAADSAALAAAMELASDDLLKQESDPEARLIRARAAAMAAAERNQVAGRPVSLQEADIRFGVETRNEATGVAQFLQTDFDPTTAVIMPQMTRRRGNPVALFFQGITGQRAGDVVTFSAATIDNRVLGVRPVSGTNIPALPLAIWRIDPSGKRRDTWSDQIDKRLGADNFGFDRTTGKIVPGPDGIPEITLSSAAVGGDPLRTNVCLIQLSRGPLHQGLAEQIRHGWTADDLKDHDGAFLPTPQQPLTAKATIVGEDAAAFEQIIGQTRLCMLYDNFEPTPNGWGRLQFGGFVAGRVCQITCGEQESRRIVFQPAVIATRSAVLAAEEVPADDARGCPRHPYLYKLLITQ